MTAGPRRFPTTWLAATLAVTVCLVALLAYRARTTKPSAKPAGPVLQAAALPGGVKAPEYEPVPGPRLHRANVVVITVDTLRRDHLAPYGASFETPAASRLAREGVVFERAVAQVPLTLPSHASLFTGLYPPRHGVHDNGGFVLGQDATTLAERFQSRGYRTAAFVSSYILHSRWGIAQGYETYDDSFEYEGLESRNLADVERPAGPVVDRALQWLRAPRRGERPFYLWVHLYDPHEPYAPPEEYRRRAPTAYAGEVMYADAQAGRLLEALDALGLRRTTVVVYHSDGYIRPIIPDLIAAGVDAITPIEIGAGLDLAELKATFGHQLGFVGGIDVADTLRYGSVDDVRRATLRALAAAGPGGGFILGSSSEELFESLPTENIIAMWETTRDCGRYPIGHYFPHNFDWQG